MNRQEALSHLKAVLRHDLNSSIDAFSLRYVLSVVIEDIRSIPIESGEKAFRSVRDNTVAALQKIKDNEVAAAVQSEHANKSRKTHEKYVAALNDYNQAVTAIQQPLQDFIAVIEKLSEQTA
jgi:hypothetical protein